MKTLLVLKNVEKRVIIAQYFKDEKEAINYWNQWFHNLDWEIVYLENRQDSGHKYELEYSRFEERGGFHSRYIICFTKKEALYLKTKILEINPNYLFHIKKLY